MTNKHNLMINNVLLKSIDCCGLCYNVADEGTVHLDSEVILHFSCNNKEIRVIDLLYLVLGPEIIEKLTTFDVICLKCMKSAANCYLFIKNCKEKSLTLETMLDSVIKSLDTLKNEDINKDNKLYVCLQCHNSYHSNCSAFVVPKKKAIIKTKTINSMKINANDESEILSKYKLNRTDILHNTLDLSNFKCKVCFLNHSTFSDLTNHFIEHHVPEQVQCKERLQDFNTTQILENHLNKCHGSIECKHCDEKFYDKPSYEIHLTQHTSSKIICSKCGRVYKNKKTYDMHVKLKICGFNGRRSNINAEYICDFCNKKYTQKTSLSTHIKFEHGTDNGHLCKWCGKRFNVISRLNAHVVKHTKEKKYNCDTCNGKFVTRESLLYHTRIHTGERPYKCEYCNERFLSASRRIEHVRRSHTKPTYTCDICSRQYKNNFCLKRHQKEHFKTLIYKNLNK